SPVTPLASTSMHSHSPASGKEKYPRRFGITSASPAAPARLAPGRRDRTRLQHLLEAAQILTDLRFGIPAEEPGDGGTQFAGRRGGLHHHLHLPSPAPPRP